MVKGLAIFRERFREYSDQYLLIGGTACDLAMTAAGLEFRATKDLDIVLCIEVLDTAFVEAFWAFVHEGDYQVRQKAEGGKEFYRFQKPQPRCSINALLRFGCESALYHYPSLFM